MHDLKTRVASLLDAYSWKNVPAVMRFLAPQTAMYGSGAAEFFQSGSSIQALLNSDFKLWDSARFGP